MKHLAELRGNLFSNIQRKIRGEVLDVYRYDELPDDLRVQIVQIWMATLGESEWYVGNPPSDVYLQIAKVLRHENGVFQLPSKDLYPLNPLAEIAHYFLELEDIEKALDVVQVVFATMGVYRRDLLNRGQRAGTYSASTAIENLNFRFRQHGVGYQFDHPNIFRVDSEFIHSEIVKPALGLLNERHLSGAREEFLKAHEFYRRGESKDAIANSLKSFESTMKAICKKRKWECGSKPTAKTLIQTCFSNGLVPNFWQQQYSSLEKILKSGVPPARNDLGGHGQGGSVVTVPNYLVAYVMHLTASAIVFLAEADKGVK